MARSIADLRLYAENVVNSAPWLKDPKCMEIPWRTVELPSKPKIAVLWSNGLVQPTPPVTRALHETVSKLKSKGYEIVNWPATDHAEAIDLLAKFFLADGGKSVENILKPVGEPFRPEMKAYEDATELGVHELWQLQKQRTALAKRYLDRWNEIQPDAVLGPVTPYAGAPKAGEFAHVGYTGVFNILDYTAASFPSGISVDKEKDAKDEGFKALNETDRVTAEQYDPEVSHGLPVSLQLTGRRLQEEKILMLTEKIEQDLKG